MAFASVATAATAATFPAGVVPDYRDMPGAAAAAKPREARFETLTVAHLDAVLAIENAAYPHPWSRRNFSDSLVAGYHAQILLLAGGHASSAGPIGYFLAMQGVDEVHLLNITVAPAHQRQGWSLVMLDALSAWARSQPGIDWLWLEVRPSNQRARAVYERYGFQPMGCRRNYYPAGAAGTADAGIREDALVMSRSLR